MDYLKIHNAIINNALSRNLEKTIYSEKHHIVPKCLNGTNSKNNIVRLLPKEHFIIHQLLYLIHSNNSSIARAFWLMGNARNKHQGLRYKYNSRIYAEAKNNLNHSKESKEKMSKSHSGKKLSESHKNNIGKAHKGRKIGPMPEYRKILISNSKRGKKVKPFTEERKKNISISLLGKKLGPMSEKNKRAISEALKKTYSLRKSNTPLEVYEKRLIKKKAREKKWRLDHADYLKKYNRERKQKIKEHGTNKKTIKFTANVGENS